MKISTAFCLQFPGVPKVDAFLSFCETPGRFTSSCLSFTWLLFDGHVIMISLTSTFDFLLTTYTHFVLSVAIPALTKLPSIMANKSPGFDEINSGILTATARVIVTSLFSHHVEVTSLWVI